MPLDFPQERTDHLRSRFAFCYTVVLVFFLLVFLRLFYLQIIRGRQFRIISAEHTMKESRLPATRGIIYDRNRIPLAENRPSFDLAIIPQYVQDIEKVKRGLSELAGIDPALVSSRWRKAQQSPSYVPLLIASDIPYDSAIRIRAAKAVEFIASDPINLQGVEIFARPLRSYPIGSISAATLGYLGEISERDLARFQKEEPGRYLLGDLVGAVGLERYWERSLRGNDGYIQKIVDAVGHEIVDEDLSSFLRREEATHGQNLVLTIDSRLQQYAEHRFGLNAGALVALDPNNGEILAMVSLPSFDPARLVSNVSRDEWAKLVSGSGHFLLNRAIQGMYPPGSTYKLVTAIAGLEEKVIAPDEKIFCRGGFQYGNRFFKCWRKEGHGAISVREAIAESCDTFFYQVGLRLGVDRLAQYAERLGFGKKTGIELEGEKGGTIPTSKWKKKVFGQEWYAGENISIAVGQGYDTVTPLQNALMAAEIATGKKLQPALTLGLEDEEGKFHPHRPKVDPEPLPFSPETLKLVRAGMLGAVQTPGGTVYSLRDSPAQIAGKTGTAQVISEEGKSRATGMDTRDHAWFVSFAPFENPKIAVAVLVEHGGFGASAAAPIAKDVIEKYLELQGVLKKAP